MDQNWGLTGNIPHPSGKTGRQHPCSCLPGRIPQLPDTDCYLSCFSPFQMGVFMAVTQFLLCHYLLGKGCGANVSSYVSRSREDTNLGLTTIRSWTLSLML